MTTTQQVHGARRHRSRAFEDAAHRVPVARISTAPTQQPVFRSPEEIRSRHDPALARPPHALVVLLDEPIRWAAKGYPTRRVGRGRHRLPRFGLPLRDDELA